MTYLDFAATTPLRPEVLEAMLPYLKEDFGNPSSVHPLGLAAREAIEVARRQIAGLVDTNASEVVFTSGATEANNLAIRGVLVPLLESGTKTHAVTTNIEHPSVAATFQDLVRRGLELTVVDAGNDGVVKAEDVLAAIKPETALVSMMRVNNELGTIQPVEKIASGIKATGSKALLHSDAVQSPASLHTSVRELGTDLMSLSAHKLGGPKGIGALIVRKGLKLAPNVTGGGQEHGLRSGTENVAAIVGFGVASGLAKPVHEYSALNAALDASLAASGGIAKRLVATEFVAPHITALEVPGADADFLVLLLGRENIMLSAGSACHAGSRDASKVLLAIGLQEKRARSVIRISFGASTTVNDIDIFVAALKKILPKARP